MFCKQRQVKTFWPWGLVFKAFRPTTKEKLPVESLNQWFSISAGLVVPHGHGDLQRPPSAMLPAPAPQRGERKGGAKSWVSPVPTLFTDQEVAAS